MFEGGLNAVVIEGAAMLILSAEFKKPMGDGLLAPKCIGGFFRKPPYESIGKTYEDTGIPF